MVVGIRGPQPRNGLAELGQVAQEQRNARQRVASVVQCRVDYAAVALAANHGVVGFHGGHHVHLAHGRGKVPAPVLLGHVAQGTRGRQVGNRIAAGLVLEHVVGHGHQRVFLAEHTAVLAHKRQPVHIRIHDNAQVVAAFFEFGRNLGQVFGQRLRVVSKHAGGVAVEQGLPFHAQGSQQHWHGHAARRVDAIYDYVEVAVRDGRPVYEWQGQNRFDVFLQVAVVGAVFAQFLHFGKRKIFAVS